ncbi:MAG: hypothetical protein JWR80_1819 [Bradyrhizobium sp.]|nr:hypothetical protein [Bradyrhizobium sp.]
MQNRRRFALALLSAVAPAVMLAAASPTVAASARTAPPATVTQVKRAVLGEWVSIAPELRPSSLKNADGTVKAFYLTRDFKALPGDRFELTVVNSVDPYGKVPLARIVIKGHMLWRGDHPIAAGAQKVDYVADEGYSVTPLLQGFADVLNKVAGADYAAWKVGETQSIFGKTFRPFGLTAGTNFAEYDLVYLSHGLLFWGARNIDGRGFDSDANRPTNLQIPLVRK